MVSDTLEQRIYELVRKEAMMEFIFLRIKN